MLNCNADIAAGDVGCGGPRVFSTFDLFGVLSPCSFGFHVRSLVFRLLSGFCFAMVSQNIRHPFLRLPPMSLGLGKEEERRLPFSLIPHPIPNNKPTHPSPRPAETPARAREGERGRQTQTPNLLQVKRIGGPKPKHPNAQTAKRRNAQSPKRPNASP